eukprot:COSAG04_NODE_15181_length_541_cov_2.099773_1_plen_152_part_01
MRRPPPPPDLPPGLFCCPAPDTWLAARMSYVRPGLWIITCIIVDRSGGSTCHFQIAPGREARGCVVALPFQDRHPLLGYLVRSRETEWVLRASISDFPTILPICRFDGTGHLRPAVGGGQRSYVVEKLNVLRHANLWRAGSGVQGGGGHQPG